jgi:hypothetical protein
MTDRGPGTTAEVEFWTSRPVREVLRSHVNHVVADTRVWEQSAAYFIDTHPRVVAFAKNAGLGLAIPYQHNGAPHDYLPDFVVRLKGEPEVSLVLETKGFDPREEIKAQYEKRPRRITAGAPSWTRRQFEPTTLVLLFVLVVVRPCSVLVLVSVYVMVSATISLASLTVAGRSRIVRPMARPLGRCVRSLIM